MSTRCTLAYNVNDFHLYQECFENDNVYLELDGTEWGASIETENTDWQNRSSAKPRLLLRVNVTLWRKIVEGWANSNWAQNLEYDHKPLELDLSFLERLAKNPKEEQETVADIVKSTDGI